MIDFSLYLGSLLEDSLIKYKINFGEDLVHMMIFFFLKVILWHYRSLGDQVKILKSKL